MRLRCDPNTDLIKRIIEIVFMANIRAHVTTAIETVNVRFGLFLLLKLLRLRLLLHPTPTLVTSPTPTTAPAPTPAPRCCYCCCYCYRCYYCYYYDYCYSCYYDDHDDYYWCYYYYYYDYLLLLPTTTTYYYYYYYYFYFLQASGSPRPRTLHAHHLVLLAAADRERPLDTVLTQARKRHQDEDLDPIRLIADSLLGLGTRACGIVFGNFCELLVIAWGLELRLCRVLGQKPVP